jgi:hypothetical protein
MQGRMFHDAAASFIQEQALHSGRSKLRQADWHTNETDLYTGRNSVGCQWMNWRCKLKMMARQPTEVGPGAP